MGTNKSPCKPTILIFGSPKPLHVLRDVKMVLGLAYLRFFIMPETEGFVLAAQDLSMVSSFRPQR